MGGRWRKDIPGVVILGSDVGDLPCVRRRGSLRTEWSSCVGGAWNSGRGATVRLD